MSDQPEPKRNSNNQDIPIGFAPDIAALMRDLADMRDAGGLKVPAQDTNNRLCPRADAIEDENDAPHPDCFASA